jgi:hypothetical protein
MASPHPSPPSPEPTWRYERKFTAHGVPLAEVAMILRLQPACFRTAFPARQVNNLYLDQSDLRSFHTHVNGAAVRDKVRIRWYGAAYGDVARPVLEVKRKRGQAGTKTRFPLAPFVYGPGFDFEAVRRDALARIGDVAVAEFVAGAETALLNRYQRDYLLSADRRFRLTIDRGLRFERVHGRGVDAACAVDERDAVILELKYAVADEAAAQLVTRRLPFRLGKYSKYLQGITRLSGLPPA